MQASTKGAIASSVILLIPGVVLLIIGGVMAGGFIEGEGSSNYSLEITHDMPDQPATKRGYFIFIQGTPGDFNGNGMHDYCENIIVNATHTGGWVSNPFTGYESYNGADETRQTFELEVAHEGSGCDAQHWPKQIRLSDGIELVKIGRACYGCQAGTTTITAEYAPTSESESKPVGMWLKDSDKIHEANTLMTIGAILTGLGILIVVIIVTVGILNAKRGSVDGTMPSQQGQREPIEIIERAEPGKPVRFRINKTPRGRDAWVGIYPADAPNQEHGDRWHWLRDIDVNNATLPGQSAGKWSIRVFQDGGYHLKHRLDFEIAAKGETSAHVSYDNIAEGKVAFKSVHGRYLSAQPDGRAEWNRDRADAWEYFHLEKRENGKIALKSAHGKYVSAQPDGSVQINRGTAPRGGWEEFTVQLPLIKPISDSGYDVVRLKSVHGKYLSAQPDGRAEWNRNHTPEGGWEDIQMIPLDGATSQSRLIEILRSVSGEPIRFKLNNPPSGHDAWVGIYPASANNADHGAEGKRWHWLRNIDVNNASFPWQDGWHGKWSIRVFSDGGLNEIDRLDFDIAKANDNAAQSDIGDRRYKLVAEDKSWNEHNDRARAMGGHLACITSARENEQVTRIAGGRWVWIGGMRKGSGNGPGAEHWYWSDGRPWTYANWAPNEPNNYGGNENRIHLIDGHSGLWNDMDGSIRGAAVYQIPTKVSAPKTTPMSSNQRAISAESMPAKIFVSGAGSTEVNGGYVFKPERHENRICDTVAGHFQHTNNPRIFIGFQDNSHNGQAATNKWMMFSGDSVRYVAHTQGKSGVPPRTGRWELRDSWNSDHYGAPGKSPAPNLSYGEEPSASQDELKLKLKSALKAAAEEEKANFWDKV